MNITKNLVNRVVSRRQLIKQIAGSMGGMGLLSFFPACSNVGPSYYTLSSRSGRVYDLAPKVIEVRTPSLSGSLDKDRIVSEVNANQLNLTANATWSDNLSSMVSRITVLNLAQRLPNSHVFAQNQATSMKSEAFVEMDISRFNQDISGKAVATISLVIYRDGQEEAGFTRLLQLEEVPEDGSLKSLVSSLDIILAKVSDIAARVLSTLP